MKVSKAVKFFGSKIRIAEALGITRSAVTNWGDNVPELREFQIKHIMNNPKHPKYPRK